MPKTGATRYQKFLKSEKAKTKLKSNKILPKGTNVTKTNFKVKKIVIREQLNKHEEDEVLTSKKLNLKELLSRLNHFNVNSRMEALNGLKELITGHPEVVRNELGALIYGVIPLALNVEKIVRRESLKVLHLVISNVPNKNIEPFFGVLSTYLRSAMTHIDNKIQEDSLFYLDIFLSNIPEMMIKDFHKIIPNFLDMISNLRMDSKPGRTLTVNLESQVTSVKWRQKVLERLQKFLEKYVEHNMENHEKSDDSLTYNFDESNVNHSLFNSSYITNCYISSFSSNSLRESIILSDEIEKLKTYMDTLMSLLFEIWLEACPNHAQNEGIEHFLNMDTAILLKQILHVISITWDLLHMFQKKSPSSDILKSFCEKYYLYFKQHFISKFPYVTNANKRNKKSETLFEDIIDPKLRRENLQICYLYINFKPPDKRKDRNIIAILEYTENMFDDNTESDAIIKLLNTIFTNAIDWTKYKIQMQKLLSKIINSYINKRNSDNFQEQIFNLLCNITLNDQLSWFHEFEIFQIWIKDLPNILLKDKISLQSINTLKEIAIRDNGHFNEFIKPKLGKIIENLPKISVETNVRYNLLSLLYWIKGWDSVSLNLLEKQLLENVYSNDHGKFIFDVLSLKVQDFVSK